MYVIGVELAGRQAHRFIPLDADDLCYPEVRSRACAVIEIGMREGRVAGMRKALIKCLFAAIETDLGMAPMDIEITIKEQLAHCWGFRGMTGDEARDLAYQIKG